MLLLAQTHKCKECLAQMILKRVAESALNDRVINDNVIDRDVNEEEGLQLV
jgi:hypothetical protein